MVLDEVLRKEPSDRFAIYAVWEPILRTDNEWAARKATTLLPDPRVRHYWIGSHAVGELFQAPIGLTTEPAWDVYLLYAPGVSWEADSPPRPSSFMHQLAGRLPDAQLLDGAKLESGVRELLAN